MSTILLSKTPVQHPAGSTLDYGFDLTAAIAAIEPGATPDTVVWTVPAPLTSVAAVPPVDGLTIRTRLSGGVVGGVYPIKAVVTLTNGEILPVIGKLAVVEP